eukprot:TRINITY_DN99403_c0_g1_i3.p1 TRINITY_DN99403_c0_g1~~TRINITY_DN99403_c0_g1_i3.p1  ORF type:complete len:193 (+),score=26.89 TRINITY_DN99403_c0_g1_i3:25-579(+)
MSEKAKNKKQNTPKQQLQRLLQEQGIGGQVRYDTLPFEEAGSEKEHGFKTTVYCPPVGKQGSEAFVVDGFGWSKQQSQQAAAEKAIKLYRLQSGNVDGMNNVQSMEEKIQRIQDESFWIINNLAAMQKRCLRLTELMMEVQNDLNIVQTQNKRKINWDDNLCQQCSVKTVRSSEFQGNQYNGLQ